MTPLLIEIQQERQAGGDAARAAKYVLGHHEAEAAHVWRGAAKTWRKIELSRSGVTRAAHREIRLALGGCAICGVVTHLQG
jgi:hypothetical protein